jgi:FtsP/CotA-like multicopper oxidase with cupredoxin domain
VNDDREPNAPLQTDVVLVTLGTTPLDGNVVGQTRNAMKLVYRLRDDLERIAAIQNATLTTKEFGIEPTHGLLGSKQWWAAIEIGSLPLRILRGSIARTYMASMNDWPEFEVVTTDGQTSKWTREANSREQAARYEAGRQVEIDYIIQRHRPASWDGGGETEIILEIRVE